MTPQELERFESRLVYEPNSGCWLWDGHVDVNGYARMKVSGPCDRLHRVSYEHFVGTIPGGLHVCHQCDIRSCVNPAHLFIGTHQDNMADMAAKGRARGGGSTRKRLSLDELLEIKDAISSGTPATTIARRFNLTRQSVEAIRRGRRDKRIAILQRMRADKVERVARRRVPTGKQKQILDFIAQHLAAHQRPPTLREIGAHFGIASTNGVNDHLRALERKGHIRRDSRKARSIVLLTTAAKEAA